MPVRSRSKFERLILPHAPAAYSLARWVMRHPQDAEDVVQEAVLRAFKAFHTFGGEQPKAWLLAIVRNTCLSAIERRRTQRKVVVLADVAGIQEAGRIRPHASDPAAQQDSAMIAEEERRRVREAIGALPLQFREVLVLREYHDLSYREIADIVGTPVGTVMSRLARGRERLAAALGERPARTESEGRS